MAVDNLSKLQNGLEGQYTRIAVRTEGVHTSRAAFASLRLHSFLRISSASASVIAARSSLSLSSSLSQPTHPLSLSLLLSSSLPSTSMTGVCPLLDSPVELAGLPAAQVP